MQQIMIVAISLHVLTAVFWAGSTFVVARTGTGSLDRLFIPQVASAIVAMASGGYLWKAVHSGAMGPAEVVLCAGAVSGLLALVTQIGFTAPALIRTSRGAAALGGGVLVAQRAAAALLAFAVVCMAAARFA
jgi:hypothetical protein